MHVYIHYILHILCLWAPQQVPGRETVGFSPSHNICIPWLSSSRNTHLYTGLQRVPFHWTAELESISLWDPPHTAKRWTTLRNGAIFGFSAGYGKTEILEETQTGNVMPSIMMLSMTTLRRCFSWRKCTTYASLSKNNLEIDLCIWDCAYQLCLCSVSDYVANVGCAGKKTFKKIIVVDCSPWWMAQQGMAHHISQSLWGDTSSIRLLYYNIFKYTNIHVNKTRTHETVCEYYSRRDVWKPAKAHCTKATAQNKCLMANDE